MQTIRTIALLGIASSAVFAFSQSPLPVGTEVVLRFEQAVSSKTAKPGDKVKFTVANDVANGATTVLTKGTEVWGVIETVNRRDRFGKNARIRLAINPVNGITLQPRDKGKPFYGSSTDKAAIASGAGLLVLGPLGLAGGYFVTGKSVNIKFGDTLRTEVSAPPATR